MYVDTKFPPDCDNILITSSSEKCPYQKYLCNTHITFWNIKTLSTTCASLNMQKHK